MRGLPCRGQFHRSKNYAIYSEGGNSYFKSNIGIGTTNPGTMLDISGGGIRANGAAETGTGLGGHVFEGNYTIDLSGER